MEISTKYDIGQKIWRIGRYDNQKPKKCSQCEHDMPFIRYRVLPKTEIRQIRISKSSFFGDVIIYECFEKGCAEESKIDCIGGIWFTTPKAAQDECDRRNRERGKTHNGKFVDEI